MADAGDSKSPVLTGVQVRLLSPAPFGINDLASAVGSRESPGTCPPGGAIPVGCLELRGGG